MSEPSASRNPRAESEPLATRNPSRESEPPAPRNRHDLSEPAFETPAKKIARAVLWSLAGVLEKPGEVERAEGTEKPVGRERAVDSEKPEVRERAVEREKPARAERAEPPEKPATLERAVDAEKPVTHKRACVLAADRAGDVASLLALGLRARDVFAFELDEGRLLRARRRWRGSGVRLVGGCVAKSAPRVARREGAFDLVFLDWTGIPNRTHLDLTARVLERAAADGAFFAVEFECARYAGDFNRQALDEGGSQHAEVELGSEVMARGSGRTAGSELWDVRMHVAWHLFRATAPSGVLFDPCVEIAYTGKGNAPMRIFAGPVVRSDRRSNPLDLAHRAAKVSERWPSGVFETEIRRVRPETLAAMVGDRPWPNLFDAEPGDLVGAGEPSRRTLNQVSRIEARMREVLARARPLPSAALACAARYVEILKAAA